MPQGEKGVNRAVRLPCFPLHPEFGHDTDRDTARGQQTWCGMFGDTCNCYLGGIKAFMLLVELPSSRAGFCSPAAFAQRDGLTVCRRKGRKPRLAAVCFRPDSHLTTNSPAQAIKTKVELTDLSKQQIILDSA
jgi:hypothetical protein